MRTSLFLVSTKGCSDSGKVDNLIPHCRILFYLNKKKKKSISCLIAMKTGSAKVV